MASRQFLSRYFTDNKTWNEWLDLKRQEWRDLVALIASDVRDEFKMRAIAILLVPHYRFLPFKWRDDSSLHNLLFLHERPIKVGELSEELRSFVATLIMMYAGLAKDYPHDDDIFSSLRIYNRYVIDFLKVLPEEDQLATELFESYELRDPVVFANMDDCSGYNPLYGILNEEIPEKWKRLASQKMQAIITSEVNGKSAPRVEHEEALKWYADQIQLPLSGEGGVRYGADLFASQVDFIISLPAAGNRGLFNSWQVGPILKIISGDERRPLRHRFARHVILENTEDFKKFSVYDSATKRAAQAMLKEFDSDQELTPVLQKLIANAGKRFQRNAEHASAEQRKVDDVLSKMK